MTETKRVRKVKAWVALSKKGGIICVEFSKGYAKAVCEDNHMEGRVVPCTITYELPEDKR